MSIRFAQPIETVLFRPLLAMWLMTQCAGCASVVTWHYSDQKIGQFLQDRRTHCESLPRIYSGVYFDYCWLNSDPQQVYGSAPIALLLIDGFFSAIADTFALPLTIVKQNEYGVLPLARPVKASANP